MYAPSPAPAAFNTQRKKFNLDYNYLLIRLYDPSTQIQKQLAPTHGGITPGLQRSLYMRSCLYAAKAFFDTTLSMTPAELLYESIVVMERTTYVLVVVTRLLLMDAPDWDVAFARLTIDFNSLTESLIGMLEAVEDLRRRNVDSFAQEMDIAVTSDDVEVTGHMYEMSRKLRWVKEWFDARVRGNTSAEWFAGDAGKGWLHKMQAEVNRAGGIPSASGPAWWGGLFSDMNFDMDVSNML
jgi:hypothetical protein